MMSFRRIRAIYRLYRARLAWRNIIGLAATEAYLTCVLIFAWPKLGTFSDLALNEQGDFWAGALGPVALFWVILGYFQTSDDLALSRKALLLQVDELRNSVRQQAQLVDVSAKQLHTAQQAAEFEALRARKASEPNFVPRITSRVESVAPVYKFSLSNRGATVSSVKLRLVGGTIFDSTTVPVWPTDDKGDFSMTPHADSMRLIVEYQTVLSERRAVAFPLSRADTGELPEFGPMEPAEPAVQS